MRPRGCGCGRELGDYLVISFLTGLGLATEPECRASGPKVNSGKNISAQGGGGRRVEQKKTNSIYWNGPTGGLRCAPVHTRRSPGPNMILEMNLFPSPLAGQILARGPAASPKAYSVLAGFEKWMVEMPCARGANVSSRNLDSWPSERYAFLPERWVVSQVRTFRGHAFVRHRATDGPLKLRAGLVVLGLLAAGRHASALRASRKSKHLPPAVVVLGRDTCDTGRVTLWWGVGSGSAPRPACPGEEGYSKTSAHSRPHELENRQIYQTKGNRVKRPWSGMLGRSCCQVPEGPASCSWTPALCHALCRGRADESRCAGGREGAGY